MTNPILNSNLEAAIYWFNYGFKVIPLVAGQKKPALPYSSWLDDLSIEAVRRYWRENPTHGVGCVLPDDVVVFDADTPEAEAALRAIETKHGAHPALIAGNLDDTFNGLLEKLEIAERLNFHMLSEGFGDAEKFKVRAFFKVMREVIDSDQARETVLILDTLKKFANLMDKAATSHFTALMREFIMRGGTLIALAHTNKHLQDGQAVPSGTSDILDDLDCAYVLQTVVSDADMRACSLISRLARKSRNACHLDRSNC